MEYTYNKPTHLHQRYIVMNTIWNPDLSTDGPKYLALLRALRDGVAQGQLGPGSQLPTVRDLAWRLSVTPGTVARAYQMGTQEGLLEATVGRGTFVASRIVRPMPQLLEARDTGAGRLDLRSPKLPDVGQGALFSAALRRMAAGMGPDWLDYTSQTQEAPLREAVCGWLADRVMGSFGPGDLMLTHGGQNAIRMVMDCVLSGDRPVVLTEELSYPGFRYAARLARAEVVTVEIDEQGLRPDALEAACLRHAAQVLCLTPEAQNPTTARMGAARRAEIVAIARRHGLQIIEDECYIAGARGEPTLRALAPERVWYVGSLSKSVSAALRFGYVVCPTDRGDGARLVAQHNFFALPQPVTALCLDLLQSGAADDICRSVQAELELRLQRVVHHLGAFDLHWQPGIAFVWLKLPRGWRASSFTRAAEEAGVLLRSADQYAQSQARVPHAVRMAVAGDAAIADLDRGLAALARLLPLPPSDMAV